MDYRATWGTNIAKDYSIKADGPLFDLPGGSVRVAVGAEYHDNSFKQTLEATNVQASGTAIATVPASIRPSDQSASPMADVLASKRAFSTANVVVNFVIKRICAAIAPL